MLRYTQNLNSNLINLINANKSLFKSLITLPKKAMGRSSSKVYTIEESIA
ncbi:hypothetical protein [Kordia sp.]|nr:hypothetical protein [Kordia sp.]MCH2194384.1 hypothetical protein [Kordia sp.]